VLELVDVEFEAFVGLEVLAILAGVMVVLELGGSVLGVVVKFVDEVLVVRSSCKSLLRNLGDDCDSAR
jgi:acyl-CoA reductase-like NAD-dependent aldehyde dehydrogenase